MAAKKKGKKKPKAGGGALDFPFGFNVARPKKRKPKGGGS
jgi:hypothetical protein